ncbi:MAG: universal stress protein [Desulfobacteraceae bacterium]|jgi:nucleotide-binding universal stress UspA family protein|nr:universal stress protein [Desulfobacteraceae bacterium]
MQLQKIKIKKILYATDLSETAVHAFSYAVSLANLYGAGITILHVLADIPMEPSVFNMIGADTWKMIRERHFDEARDKLIGKRRDGMAMREVLAAFSEGAKASPEDQAFVTDDILIGNGSPAEVIVDTAKLQSCDLIVMGTHGHGGIAGALIGSTAKRVVRESAIPVLVVRLP